MSEYDLSELLKGIGVEELTEELQEKIDELVKSKDRYKPKYINISAPHAKYMEFGTKPITQSNDSGETSSNNEKDPEIVVRIAAWAKAIHLIPKNRPKNAGAKVSDDEYRHLAYAIAHKIAKEGLEPRPFIRPVIYDTNLLEEARKMIGEGKSMEDVAELYAYKMIELAHDKFHASKFEKPSGYEDELHIQESITVSDKPLDDACTDYDFSYEYYATQSTGVKKHD